MCIRDRYDTCLLKELGAVIGESDFIFNTIPSLVLDAALANQVQENAAVIDIASAPGGVDFQALERRNIRARLCPGLPGRCSPLSDVYKRQLVGCSYPNSASVSVISPDKP